MTIGIPSWVESYLNIPYKDWGFTREGLHCWGLIHLIYQERLKIELSKYSEFTAKDLHQAMKLLKSESQLPPWTPVVGLRQTYDVVLMKVTSHGLIRRTPSHVGLSVGNSYILHNCNDIPTACMLDSHPLISSSVVAAYRHQDLL